MWRGSPLDDVLVPGVRAIPAEARMMALATIVRPSLTAIVGLPRPTAPIPADVGPAHDVAVVPDGACLRLRVEGPRPELILRGVVGGGRLWLDAGAAGSPGVTLEVLGTWPEEARLPLPVAPDIPSTIAIPDLGSEVAWGVRLDSLPAGETELCLSASGA